MNESVLWQANLTGGHHRGKRVEVRRPRGLVDINRTSENKAVAILIDQDGNEINMGQICIGYEGEMTADVIKNAVLAMLNNKRNR